jgi:ubiquinone/menaquinone biosynthesis C-methylase UbiE/uncharacterized protein YbaR (Trm112 family)
MQNQEERSDEGPEERRQDGVTLAPVLQELLVCPLCHGQLSPRGDPPALICRVCDVEYAVRFGVPVLLPPDFQQPTAVGEDDHERELSHKARQAAYFDQEGDDFGVIRPHGAPELYGRLMREKFRRSVVGLEDLLPGSTALVVCGGAGMDAEFLVESGAGVILSDISLGVVLQARERARRFGFDLALIVADAEALPFRDASVDLAYVHDGLHHLERPELGLAEMARVARRAVSVSEPARALATRWAIRLGWAQEVEEAGNPVMRLTIEQIVDELGRHGFRPIRAHRYAMFYRHWPGRPMRLLSRPVVLQLTLAGFRFGNRLLGRIGNKLVVQAVRTDERAPLER